MGEIISLELKKDLENIYKITGDLLNSIEARDIKCNSHEAMELFDLIKFKLMDIGGTLQKDIFNCDYLETKVNIKSQYNM